MKTALVTGASTGIGAAIAEDLAEMGYKVYAGVRKEADGQRLEQANSNIQFTIIDVTNATQIQQAVESIPTLDLLVNNAGIAVGGPIELTDINDWKKVFEVNVFGAVETTRAFLPKLRESKGHVINISSISGFIASPFMSIYASSKFALEAFSDSLRREVKPHGVRVTVIQPGPIKTPIWEKSLGPAAVQFEKNGDPEVKKIYEDRLKSFATNIEKAAKSAAPVNWVTKSIRHALQSKWPKTRYVVGKDRPALKMFQYLPDRAADKLILSLRR